MRVKSEINPATAKMYLGNVIVCVLALIASCLLLSVFKKVDVVLLLNDFWQTRVVPNKNTVEIQTHSNVSPTVIYYTAIVFAALFLLISQSIRPKSVCQREFFFRQMKMHLIILSTIFILSQTISHIRYFSAEMKKFGNKTSQEKISNNFKKSYAFAQYCKNQLPGKHVCLPLTDTNSGSKRNLLTYAAVQYYLYPLDIVTSKAHPDVDCMIIFLKNDPESYISPPFRARPAFDAKSLIAVKEDLSP